MSRGRDAVSGAMVLLVGAVLLTGCTATTKTDQPTGTAQATAPIATAPATAPSSSAPLATSDTTPPTSTSTPPPLPPPSTLNPTPSADATASLQTSHDNALASVLTSLSTALRVGNRTAFLSDFSPSLRVKVGHWFDNTRVLGVSDALFSRADDYSSVATDAATSFSRTVVLGIRTPYDDAGSMAGIPYSVVASIATSRAGPRLHITTWQPKFLGDPMDCGCKLAVVHTSSTAVMFDSADGDLAFWSQDALTAARSGIGWADSRLAGSGLTVPKGQVLFLADKPFHWFLGLAAPAQKSNITAGLIDALGAHPGRRYSNQSRIVVMLQMADGTVLPNDQQGREYVAEVAAHESTHQLFNRNSELPNRTDDSPPIWAVEGIAVAVETLYRDSLGDAGNVGLPEPNDPKNIDPGFFRSHLGEQMPARSQLYSPHDGPGYYAMAGSVFRYLHGEYGYPTMLAVAKAVYARPQQDPFAYFPDPARPGAFLTAAVARTRWKNWFVHQYEN